MQASFIIPLYNCLDLTQAMLASLRNTLPSGFESEIIFVDDGSTDGTRAWLAKLSDPCRVILNEKNVGFAAACNRGAAAARGEFIFFLNNDLILQPRWLEPMLGAFNCLPDAGLVGNVQLNAATGEIDHTGLRFNHKGKPEHDTGRPLTARITGYREVPALTGACFAIRRTVWQQLHGFDEGFTNGAEDVDLCLRGSSTGLRHYIALRSVVRHHVSASVGRKLRDEQNSYRLVRRWNDAIVRLSAREWSRHFITTHWDQSFVYDDALGREAFFYALGILKTIPPRVRSGTQDAVDFELDRWRKLFSVAP
jgi:GT2 family glycosyltransferase